MAGERHALKCKIDEELRCGICHDRLTHPKVLTQCSHSFCKDCLEKLHVSNQKGLTTPSQGHQLECPLCRKVTELHQGTIEDLPTNYPLQNVAGIISEAPEEEQKDLQPICQQHQSVLNQYCSTCNELLCSECIHGPKHREHLRRGEIHLTHEILPESLEFLSAQLSSASELASHAATLQEEVDRKKQATHSNSKTTEAKINSFFKEMAENLEQRRKLLVSGVERYTSDELTVLDRHSKKLNEIHQSAVSTTDAVKRLRQCQDVHALTEGKALVTNLQLSQQSLKSLDSQLQEQRPAHVLNFQADRSLEQQISSLGALMVCASEPNSPHLRVRRQLRVSRDGNIFINSLSDIPAHQAHHGYSPEAMNESPVPFEGCLINPQLLSPNLPDNAECAMGILDGQREDPSSYEAVVTPTSTNRPEPEMINPLKVINCDQLRDPHSNDEVYPTGVCVSPFDNITITDTHNHCLRQVDQNGSFLQTFGRRGKAVWEFDTPTAIVVTAHHLYVTSQVNGLAQKLSVNGNFVSSFGKRHLQSPRGIAISQINGNVYVADSKRKRVCIYREDCTYQRSIGKRDKNIQFQHPVGVAFDNAGNLLVVDRGEVPCVWYISQPEGELLGKIGKHYLHYPFDVAVTKNGSIVVTERGKVNSVSVFSPQGQVIRCFGKTGSKLGEFNGPSGVAVNSQGQIIVADQHNQRLQIFDLEQ